MSNCRSVYILSHDSRIIDVRISIHPFHLVNLLVVIMSLHENVVNGTFRSRTSEREYKDTTSRLPSANRSRPGEVSSMSKGDFPTCFAAENTEDKRWSFTITEVVNRWRRVDILSRKFK